MLSKILLIAVLLLLVFGASRLGAIGKGLGEGIRNFKKGIAGDDDDDGATAQGGANEVKEPKQLPPKREVAEDAEPESKDVDRA